MAIDVVVIPATLESWLLHDRLARPLGQITKKGGSFWIEPGTDKNALTGLKKGAFLSLDLAMSAIESHTKGACQLATSE